MTDQPKHPDPSDAAMAAAREIDELVEAWTIQGGVKFGCYDTIARIIDRHCKEQWRVSVRDILERASELSVELEEE